MHQALVRTSRLRRGLAGRVSIALPALTALPAAIAASPAPRARWGDSRALLGSILASAALLAVAGCSAGHTAEPSAAQALPAGRHELPDLTILEPKIPATIAVEGGVPLVTAVGAQGRQVVGVVAQPIPAPELSPEEMKLLGIDPNRRSYFEQLIALHSAPDTPDRGVYPWSAGENFGSAGRTERWLSGPHSAPVMHVVPSERLRSEVVHAPVRTWHVGLDSARTWHVYRHSGGVLTAENEAKRISTYTSRR
ncbi:MAG: hypothetical protein IPM64_01285 [Phycisphaerales bacterium]|nr:hypothetical protein [Phycisphaerales bacterium]